MKYFIIEGTIKNADLMNDDIMKKHMAYSQEAMDKGLIVMSGLKEDMSGGLFIMKSEDAKVVEEYLFHEPLKVNGIQDYRVKEFSIHYLNKSIDEWTNK